MRSYPLILQQEARDAGIPMLGIEPFARLPYKDELALKRKAVQRFVREALHKRDLVEEIVKAPMPRHYRSTSRRRLHVYRGNPSLVHGDGSSADQPSPLEHATHANIYAAITKLLPSMEPFGREALNHIVVRGTYDEQALILTVDHLDASIVRMCRTLATRVQKSCPTLVHAWIYVDPKRSRFYLELERPVSGVSSKKIFGAAAWKQIVGEVTYQVGVFSFSQINLAMLPVFVGIVQQEALVTSADTLFDVFCGFGLFSASMARSVKKVYAVDQDKNGIDAARYNIGRASGKVEARYIDLDVDSVAKWRSVLKDTSPSVMVLDPPRTGTVKGVIAELAQLGPRRVVCAFSGPDEIIRSISEWKSAGYDVVRVLPLDLFPGTTGIEFVITFDKR